MPEFIVSTTQKTPANMEICELTATVTDEGVEIFAKSPVIADFIASRSTGDYAGKDYVRTFAALTFHALPNRIVADIGGNGIYADLFFNSRNNPDLPPGIGDRRISEPNMVWLRAKGLEEGVRVVFPQPAHVPADLIEYLNRSMEKVRVFYMKYVRKTSVRAVLIEKADG